MQRVQANLLPQSQLSAFLFSKIYLVEPLLTPVTESLRHMCIVLCKLLEFLFFSLLKCLKWKWTHVKLTKTTDILMVSRKKQGDRIRPGDAEERAAGDPTVAAWSRSVKGGTLAPWARATHFFGPVPHQWPFRGCNKGAR